MTMSDRRTNWLSFIMKTTSTTTTAATTTTNDVRWENINVGFNTAVQILACSLPSAGHLDKHIQRNCIVVAGSQALTLSKFSHHEHRSCKLWPGKIKERPHEKNWVRCEHNIKNFLYG